MHFSELASEVGRQYSVLPYGRDVATGVPLEVMERVVESNNLSWAAEHVFGINYHEYFLYLKDGELRSPDFGVKTLGEMCDDAISIRETAGVSTSRVKSEKDGIIRLEQLIKTIREGETVMLISPPDPDDANMGGYNMIYLYEKRQDGVVRATAIRDESSSISDLRVLAQTVNGVLDLPREANHLDFVSHPIATRYGFDQLVEIVGVSERETLPDWLYNMSHVVALAMLSALECEDIHTVKKLFDAFQMSVKIRYERETRGKEIALIDPLAMLRSRDAWLGAQRQFLALGGEEMVRAGGSCGAGDIRLERDNVLDNNMASRIFGIDEKEPSSYSGEKMECVECPFCHKTVDAILTSEKIKCPECNAEVSR